jgi:Tetratricopeptide repeat
VLITSREHSWTQVAAPVDVDVLARPESVAILQGRVPELGAADAGQLAAALGDLPLAVAQAGGFMAETGMPAAEYLDVLGTRAGQLLAQAPAGADYPGTLAAATQLIADRLAAEDPAAAQLAGLCAFLAPEPIPEDLFTAATGELPDELAARAADPLAWRQTLAHLTRQSLTRIDQRGLVMHRLTQAILRDHLSPAQATATRGHSEAILAASNPGDWGNPATWPRWAVLMPHLLAADLAATGNRYLRWMACGACGYLLSRGDTSTGYDLAHDLYQHWRERFGDDHENTLAAATYLAVALRVMGRYAEARDLDRATLDRNRRIMGDDHPATLISAGNLATNLRRLGEVQAARDLSQHTHDRYRQVMGDDDPGTLVSAANLALDLRALGDLQAARDLNQDTLERCRRVLGDDHPATLDAANNLALDLHELGDLQAARDLNQDTLERRRRVLGDDHPSTLDVAHNLARDLRALGDAQAALDLEQDTRERRRRPDGEDHTGS